MENDSFFENLQPCPKQHSKFDDSHVYTRKRKCFKVLENDEDTNHKVFKVNEVEIEACDLEICNSQKFGNLTKQLQLLLGFSTFSKFDRFFKKRRCESYFC